MIFNGSRSDRSKKCCIRNYPDPTVHIATAPENTAGQKGGGFLLEIFFVRLGSAAFFLSGEEFAGGRQREHREAAVRAHPDLVPAHAQ
jgi:hypothetical protein